ncbi:jg22200, partial [Pararge aegeria aegeria]
MFADSSLFVPHVIKLRESYLFAASEVVCVNIEEVLSVEVSTARAVCVGGCIPISALVKGISHRYLSTSREPDWKTLGDVEVKNGSLCGLKEGFGRVRAALGGVWSSEVE